jgi:hypothetical protein
MTEKTFQAKPRRSKTKVQRSKSRDQRSKSTSSIYHLSSVLFSSEQLTWMLQLIIIRDIDLLLRAGTNVRHRVKNDGAMLLGDPL